MEVIELARDSLNPDLELLGVLLNLADMRTVHSREALASLKERFGDRVFDTVDPLLDRLRRVGRARALDPRPPPRPRRRLPGRSPAKCSARLAADRRPRASAWRSCAEPGRRRLELAHVGALRLERRAQQRRPAVDLAAQRLDDGAGLLVEAPHEHRRAGA